jgi:hypothetical protein
MLAVASGFQAPATKVVSNRFAAATSQPRFADVRMEEPTDKAVTIGAAAVGGIVGVYIFHELSTAVFLSCLFAYGSTLSNGFGNASKNAGSAAAKVYSKTLEINEEYDVLPKAKSALDTVTTAAANLDSNYGISASVDEKLKLTQAYDKAVDKLEEVKGSVTSKVDDLKSKASS